MRCFIYRQSQLDIGWTELVSRLDEIAAEDHSNIATAAERARRENTWVLVLDSSGPNGPMKPRKIANVYVENLAKLTTDFILESKFKCDQTNHLLRTTKVRSASTQRQAGSGLTLSQEQTLLPQGGTRLHGGSHRHQHGVSDNFYLQIEVFRLEAMAILL